jgi:predicted DNA-binding transcriptional regulator AlpA
MYVPCPRFGMTARTWLKWEQEMNSDHDTSGTASQPPPGSPPSHGPLPLHGSPPSLLVDADAVARMLNISPRTVWRLLSAGKLIEPVRVGGNTRWRVDELRQWIADGCPPPNGAS